MLLISDVHLAAINKPKHNLNQEQHKTQNFTLPRRNQSTAALAWKSHQNPPEGLFSARHMYESHRSVSASYRGSSNC